MATTHPVSPPDDRTGRRRLVFLGLAIILVFAVIGVVSAGIFLGSALSTSAKSGARGTHTTPVPSSLQDIRRAQAQATKIVAQARKNAKVAARGVTGRARTQATALVATARSRAGAIAAAVPTAAPPPPAGSPAGSGVPPSNVPSTSGTGAAPGGAASSGAVGSAGVSGAPDLSGVPASWKVVAFNPTLGTGSGLGTVTVLNRSTSTFSGTVKIAYAKGGAAYASFSGLAPGQSEVLALSGTPYPGGGYTILLPTVH